MNRPCVPLLLFYCNGNGQMNIECAKYPFWFLLCCLMMTRNGNLLDLGQSVCSWIRSKASLWRQEKCLGNSWKTKAHSKGTTWRATKIYFWIIVTPQCNACKLLPMLVSLMSWSVANKNTLVLLMPGKCRYCLVVYQAIVITDTEATFTSDFPNRILHLLILPIMRKVPGSITHHAQQGHNIQAYNVWGGEKWEVVSPSPW